MNAIFYFHQKIKITNNYIGRAKPWHGIQQQKWSCQQIVTVQIHVGVNQLGEMDINCSQSLYKRRHKRYIYLCTIQNQFLIQKRCVHFDKHTRNILEITKSCSIFFQSADFQLKGVCIYPLISTWGLFVALKWL